MAHVRSDEGSAMIESLWPRATWAINASPTEKPVGADELHGVLPDRQVLKGAFGALGRGARLMEYRVASAGSA